MDAGRSASRSVYRSAATFAVLTLVFAGVLWLGERDPRRFVEDDWVRLSYRAVFLLTAPGTILLNLLRLAHPPDGSLFRALIVAGIGSVVILKGLYRLGPIVSPRRMRSADKGLDRRRFLRTAAGAVGATGLALAARGVAVEPRRLRLREYKVPLRGLPTALDGLRILHVSDTHFGPFISLAFLKRVLQAGDGLHPDLVCLTGDYVHHDRRAIGPGIEVLQTLRPRLGVVAVLGNHDHWEGVDACRAAFDSIKIALIDNGRLFLSRRGLSSEPSRDALCIAGVGDLWEDRVDLPAALKDAPADMPRILLSHNPDVAELGELAFNRVDLMLSGHTHGGQVALPVVGALRVPSRFGQRYAGGLCPGPACPVIVSRGVGMTILPVRFGVPPEIGLITLVANDNR